MLSIYQVSVESSQSLKGKPMSRALDQEKLSVNQAAFISFPVLSRTALKDP